MLNLNTKLISLPNLPVDIQEKITELSLQLSTHTPTTCHPLSIKGCTELYVTLQQALGVQVKEQAKLSTKQFREHVRKELLGGGKSLFKFISKHDKQFLNVDVASLGPPGSSPQQCVEHTAQDYFKLWAPDEQTALSTKISFNQSHRLALETPDDYSFTDKDLFLAAKHYKKRSKGIDHWDKNEILLAPPQILKSISEVLQESLSKVVQPIQNLLNLNPLLGKPKGHRTICKTPMLYRFVCKSMQQISTWSNDCHSTHDACVKGSSAHIAAAVRSTLNEAYTALNHTCINVLNDFSKFFDTVDPTILLRQSMVTGFPTRALVWTLGQHLAPRVIQAEGIVSTPQQVTRSILAGCKHSVAIVKMYLHADLTHMQQTHTQTHISAYVDDITVEARARSTQELAIATIDAMRQFQHISHKLKLTLSEKGQLVCSNLYVGAKVARSLSRLGIPITHVRQAKDLGQINAAGKPIHRLGARNRLTSTRQRVRGIIKLSRISPLARRLYSGSGFAASTWGQVTRLYSSSNLLQVERDAANATGIHVYGRNLFFTNVVAYGVYGHPIARIFRELIQSHFQVYSTIVPDRITAMQYRRAWSTIYSAVQSKFSQGGQVLAQSTGPVFNLIYLLRSVGWDPVLPDLWNHEGDTYVYSPNTSTKLITKAVIDSLNHLGLQSLDASFCGLGSIGGICYHTTLAYHRSLKTKLNKTSNPSPDAEPDDTSNDTPSLLGALECLLAGAIWPADRIHEVKPEVPNVCQGVAPPTQPSINFGNAQPMPI